MPLTDINTIEDVQLLVDTFYSNVRKDDLIGPVFNEKIGDRWSQHLQTMYDFWQTILLDEHTYYGAPFPPHAQLPVGLEHFERWLSIFYKTVTALFTGEKAERAIWQGQRMAEKFHSKIEYHKMIELTKNETSAERHNL